MTQILKLARDVLLSPTELNDTQLIQVLSKVLSHRIDEADIYVQMVCSESWSLEDGQVKAGHYAIDQGVGIRAIAGEKTGFAYTNDLILPALTQAADAAKNIAKHGQQTSIKIASASATPAMYPSHNPLDSLTTQEKITLLERVDRKARSLDPRISKVDASLSGVYEVVLVLNAEGQLIPDVRPLVRLNVSVIAEQAGRREQGFSGGGGRGDYAFFLSEDRALSYAEEAVRQALVNLDAVDAPAGTMPVVLGPGWPGVLLHEAVGHGLEGDANRKGVSAFSGRIGEQVSNPEVTVVDNGTLEGRRGSLTVDDEGTKTQCTTLIEKGVLVGYMQDKLNARLMGMHSTGNCRRESYAYAPMPRMTNTYMLAGKYAPEEIIKTVKKGLYAANFSGGQVDITSGQFVFSASEAYLIENGRITRPVKGATLIGNGPDVMQQVAMVGSDLALDTGIGICGKDGQSVPVGVGMPTVKVNQITVGGTSVS